MGCSDADDDGNDRKAMTEKTKAPTGAMAQAVRRMREIILSLPDGAPLGPEDDLMASLSLSRPTLRQVARILEQEQLLVVRRGKGGGYYGRRPDIGAVTQAAALYLHLRQTKVRDILHVSHLVNVEAARLAATNGTADDLAALEQLRDRLRASLDRPYPPADLVRDDMALYAIFMRMVDNPPLELFYRTLFEFGQRDTSFRVFHDHPERCDAWRQGRLRMIDAVLARDPEISLLLAQRQTRMILDWVEPDMGRATIIRSE